MNERFHGRAFLGFPTLRQLVSHDVRDPLNRLGRNRIAANLPQHNRRPREAARLGRRVHDALHQQRRPLPRVKSQDFTLREKNPAGNGGNVPRVPTPRRDRRRNESCDDQT